MNYDDAISSAIDGNCLLFLGAGFSLGAKNFYGEDILSSADLAIELCNRVGVEVTKDLKDAADDYIEIKNDLDCVVEEISTLLKASSVDNFHKDIASIDWRYVYTTNYDNVYELACLEINKNYKYATLATDIHSISVKDRVILHVNGMIEFLNKDNIMSEFKLTNVSYTTSEFLSSDWYKKLIRDINLADAIFFVGYSLYDIDIKRIFDEHPEIAKKTFFILGRTPCERLQRKIKPYGVLLNKTASDFAEDIEDAKKTHVKKETPCLLTSFSIIQESSYSIDNQIISNDDVFEMFFFGKIDKNKLYYDITSNDESKYYVVRTSFDEVCKIINNGNAKNILLQSEFGNGKTLIIEGIKVFCSKNKIKCYQLLEENENTGKELCEILKETSKQVLIIENFNRYRRSLEQISSIRPANLVIVLTERTSVSETNMERLHVLLNAEPSVFQVDKLDDGAIADIIRIFDVNGFWHEFSGKSDVIKTKIIRDDYNRSISGLLLGALKSHDIKNRLLSIYSELNKNSLYRDIITVACILNVIDMRADLHDILDFLGKRIENRIVFDSNQAVKQLFNNNTYELSVKSSVFTRFILTEFATSDYIVSVLLKMYKHRIDRKKSSEWHKNVARSIDLFSTIQSILPNEGRLESSKKFFDAIRELNNNYKNYHYWLQYAISRTVYDDFAPADMCFQSSYSLYDKIKKNINDKHAMLDNHYARFLMLRLTKSSLRDDAFFDDFKEADSIVQHQIFDDTTHHYPYRVILLYLSFYRKFEGQMSGDQHDYILARAKFYLQKIEILSDAMKNNRYVNDSRVALQGLLNEA